MPPPAADHAPARRAWIEDVVAALPATLGPTLHAPLTPAVRREVAAFARALEWTLRVPGSHPSGPAYDDLLGWLEEQGRPFLADTKALRSFVRTELVAFVERLRRAPSERELREAAAKLVVVWVVKRFENKVQDVRIKRNEQTYLRRKFRRYGESRPGMRTGALRDAIAADARVEITT